ncbi:MAG: CBS domain-containing protein [Thermoplasmata archaeon]
MVKAELLDIKAKNIMTKDVVSAERHEKVSEILGRMKTHGIHEIPVIEKNKVLGLVSYSNILKKRQIPVSTAVENIMVRAPKVTEDHNIIDITRLMLDTDFKALPVIDNEDKIVGIVSRIDILKNVLGVKEVCQIPLEQVMMPDPITVSEDDDIMLARQKMLELSEQTLPVVDSLGRLSGVISGKDLAAIYTEAKKAGIDLKQKRKINIMVKSFMSRPAVSASSTATVEEAINLMLKHNVSSVIVVKEDKPIGVVTHWDLLELLAKEKEQEGVYIQITGMERQDAYETETIYDIIGKYMERINRLERPTHLNLHVSELVQRGGIPKYEIRVKLTTVKKMYFAQYSSWSVFECADEVLNRVERQVKKEVEKKKI